MHSILYMSQIETLRPPPVGLQWRTTRVPVTNVPPNAYHWDVMATKAMCSLTLLTGSDCHLWTTVPWVNYYLFASCQGQKVSQGLSSWWSCKTYNTVHYIWACFCVCASTDLYVNTDWPWMLACCKYWIFKPRGNLNSSCCSSVRYVAHRFIFQGPLYTVTSTMYFQFIYSCMLLTATVGFCEASVTNSI